MQPEISISSTLSHDGDRCARFTIEAANRSISAQTGAWSDTDEHLTLADSLAGFPKRPDSTVSWQIDNCSFEFACTDELGHIGLWVVLVSDDTANGSRSEQAHMFFRCDPVSIDTFALELRAFVRDQPNRATLRCLVS